MDSVKSTQVLTQKEDKKSSDLTWTLCLTVFAAVLGMFNFGYNSTVVSAPQLVIESFFNESYVARHGSAIPSGRLTFLWALTVAIMAIGGMFGAVIGGWWADKFGRNKGLRYNCLIGIIAGIFMGLSKAAQSVEMLVIGRLVIGFNCGLATGLAPIFTSEIAPYTKRGAIGTVNQLAVTFGLLLGQVFGLTQILGTEDLWPVLFGLAGVVSAVQLLLLCLCPESPRFLLINGDDKTQCATALQRLRGTEDIMDEMNDFYKEKLDFDNLDKQMSIIQVLKSSDLSFALVVAVVMHLSQQFSGINCIFYYAVSLFQNVGLTEEEAKYANLGVGGIMVVMTMVSIPLMDRAGRRTLHLVGLAGMFVLITIFTICFNFAIKSDGEALQYVSITVALGVVVFFALGPGSIPWMIVPEIFSQGPRAAATNVGVLVNWSANFVVGITFPYLLEGLNELVFVPYIVLLFIFLVALYNILPETKGKTFNEIREMLGKRSDDYETSQTRL